MLMSATDQPGAPAAAAPPAPRARPRRRVFALLGAGLALVAGALAFRSSPWARERQLARANLTTLQSLALASPRDARVQYYLGTQYYNADQPPEALAAFRKA